MPAVNCIFNVNFPEAASGTGTLLDNFRFPSHIPGILGTLVAAPRHVQTSVETASFSYSTMAYAFPNIKRVLMPSLFVLIFKAVYLDLPPQ